MNSDHIRKLRIIHFNDCYNIDEQSYEPKGGACRFLDALLSKVNQNTIVLFSGDIISPSIMSKVTKGMHMIPVINLSRAECAVFGNHEFDFSLENLKQFVQGTKNCKWLMSNVINKETNRPLGDGDILHTIERNGVKIGLIGVVEKEWLSTLATLACDDLIYLDFIRESRKLAKILREEHKCDIVIALTHMRWKNDRKLARNVDEIDLFLGGHDHDHCIQIIDGKCLLKSGSDFREFSTIDLEVDLKSKIIQSIYAKRIEVTSTKYRENKELKKELDKYKHVIEEKLDQEIAHFDVELDARFGIIRTQETNLGNLICDMIITATKADCVILNSGTLRSDTVHKPGPFTLRELFRIFPTEYPMIMLSVSGHTIWEALENGVSQYPKHEGRFPQVAGIRFAFDPRQPPGQRVDPELIKIGDEYLDLSKDYKLATKVFLSKGRDGYLCLKKAKVLVSEEESADLVCVVQNFFESINKILKGASTRHDLSLVAECSSTLQTQKDEIEFARSKLAPQIEGRIIRILNDEMLDDLRKKKNQSIDI